MDTLLTHRSARSTTAIYGCIWSLSHWPIQRLPILVSEAILPQWSHFTPWVWPGLYCPTQPLTSPWLMSILENHVYNPKGVEGCVDTNTHGGDFLGNIDLKQVVLFCFLVQGMGKQHLRKHGQTGKVRADSLRQIFLVPRKHWEEKLWEDMGDSI